MHCFGYEWKYEEAEHGNFSTSKLYSSTDSWVNCSSLNSINGYSQVWHFYFLLQMYINFIYRLLVSFISNNQYSIRSGKKKTSVDQPQ